MKRILFLLLLLAVNIDVIAQDKQVSSQDYKYFTVMYPYNEVLDFIGNPDTLMFCNYYLRRYSEEGTPNNICLYIYKKNNSWWGASLLEYAGDTSYWDLTRPMYIHTDLSEKMEELLYMFDSISDNQLTSAISTHVHIKYSEKVVTQYLYGNMNDYMDKFPIFAYIFTVGFLESYNDDIVISYKRSFSDIMKEMKMKLSTP